MRLRLGKRVAIGAAMTIVLGAIAVAAITAAGIAGWEYSNSNAFCANVCHSVHPEEPKAHAASLHARVNCVECHMGRLSTLQLMAIKPTHVNELWGMIVGYERPITTHSLRPAEVACEACHWPQARHSDTVRVRYRYDDDAKSTEGRTTLQLHTGGGEVRGRYALEETGGLDTGMNVGKGIHWHIAQELDYVALDAQKQKIPLIEVHGSDGKVIATYVDATAGVSRADLDKMPKRRMDCIDCHNAAGHPFPNPADLVDEGLQEGLIDRALLPSIKARSDKIIQAAYGIGGTEDERGAKFDAIIANAAPKGEQKPEVKTAEQKFAGEMKRILLLTSFSGERDGKALTWRTFPNNVGHKDFPGCFRCHDGKHVNEKGDAIRLQCTLCHALPQVDKENGVHTVASTVSPGMSPPDSHLQANWMRDHRASVDDSCTLCHGKISWGKDGGSFCSNPACHGRAWPEVNLDATSGSAPSGGATPAPAKGSAPKSAGGAAKKS